MKTNLLATAVALSDQDLLARLNSLARTERESAAELVAHLTALELRPSLYLAEGYGSLFDYCTRALGLPEDAACNRTKAVRACRQFPVILDYLFEGALTVTSVRLLAPHLTAENHEGILTRARNKRLQDIQALVAEVAPRPDVPATVRKLPMPKAASGAAWMEVASDRLIAPTPSASSQTLPGQTRDDGQDRFVLGSRPSHPPRHRPIVQPLAAQRYRVQFTIGEQAHDDLRTVQALLPPRPTLRPVVRPLRADWAPAPFFVSPLRLWLDRNFKNGP
jgi:hypothetical protein